MPVEAHPLHAPLLEKIARAVAIKRLQDHTPRGEIARRWFREHHRTHNTCNHTQSTTLHSQIDNHCVVEFVVCAGRGDEDAEIKFCAPENDTVSDHPCCDLKVH
jgi:hypothetical protein